MADRAYKYLDATNRVSDPSETTLLYVDARHEYTDPATVDILRLDATNNWSMAEVGKLITADQLAAADWRDVAFTARAAAKSPQSYAGFVGKTKTLTASDSQGTYNLTARIDGVGQDTLEGGATGGFTFEVTKGLPRHVFNKTDHYAAYAEMGPQNSAYDTSEARSWLESLTFEEDVARYMKSFAVKYRRPQRQDPVDPARPDEWQWKPPTAAETLYAKVAPLSMANYFPTGAADGFSDVVFEDEGPLYDYFKGTSQRDAKRYVMDEQGKAQPGGWASLGVYTLTPHTFGFVGVSSPEGGPTVLHEAWQLFGMSCRFVLGSSR